MPVRATVAAPHAWMFSCPLLSRIALVSMALVLGAAVHRAAAQDGPTPDIMVTPDGGYDPDRPKNSSGHTTVFQVINNSLTTTYVIDFICITTGGVTCTNITPSSVTLTPGQWQNITVTYSVGASGGEVRLWADDYDSGYKLVTTPPTLTVLVPAVTHGPDTVLLHTRTPLALATYNSTDATIDTTTLVVKVGTDTVTPLTRRNRRLMEWEVDLAHQLQPGVVKDLYVRICHTNAGCTAVTRKLRLDDSGPPIVSFGSMPLERSSSAGEVETGLAVPAYASMGVARSAGLVYSTRQSYPRALVNVDIELTWPTGNPDQIKAVLIDAGIRLDSLVATTPTCQASTGRRCRVTLQGDFSGTTYVRAVRKWLKVEVTVVSGAASKMTMDSVEVVLVDRRSAAYGSGWFVAGVLRLDSAYVDAERTDRFLVGPTGAVSVLRGAGGVYLAPPGDRSVLTWTGAQWHLRLPARGGADQTKVVFDVQGRHIQSVDAHNNITQFKYGALDRVDTIIDPLGKKTAFLYSGGKLTTIRDPGSRDSRVTIDASYRLVYDSLASPGANSHVGTFAYTAYGANNTYVLSSWTDAIGQTTTIAYDARRRPYQTTLPPVLPESGTTPQSPVLTYRAQVLRGLDTLLSADSIFGRVTDPRGMWTRSLVTRWGQPERTWDALGTMSRTAYDADGRPLWTEGKVADSTRAFFTYDGRGRLIRSYRRRTTSDTVLLDSVVYDATYERVTARFNPLRQATTYTYNGYGDVATTRTPTGDTTYYTYLSNGQLNQMKAPMQTGWTTYAYDATWKNLLKVTNPNGVVLDTNSYDAVGRLVQSRRKRIVRFDGATTYMRWQRTLTGYLQSNQVDSVRTEITNECVAPCTTPPAWPTGLADSLRWQHVRHAYDRLGRDTARYNTRDKRTRYVYDGLGRLRARYPFADSAAIVDSFRYDLGGNLRYHWTRRGALIEHRYDSRSRDTLTLVPGVGNYRRIFGGPNDELTRLAIASYTDPIGGVNPSVSWVYSQAGLLLADTAQGTCVTTYHYDRYGRDTVSTDVRGTTRYRYDAVRGVLDSIVTPFADSLHWTIDARSRHVGPYITNGGDPDFATVPTWDQVGKLTDLITTHGTVTVGHWQLPSDEPAVPDLFLVPWWSEQQGSIGPTVTAEDSVAHDGWGRVTAVTYRKNGVVLTNDLFTFDRDGNINSGGGQITYDRTTTRLVSQANGAWTYAYDRAGNLVSKSYFATTWTYEYDALDRLITYREGGNLVARYAYDALGRRIVKRVYSPYTPTTYTRMIYRGAQVVAEADSAGALTLAYTWGLGVDNLVAVRRYTDSQTWYVVQDVLHNVRGLTKRDGTWVASWRYYAYGTMLDSAGTAPFPLRYRWTGREFDSETGLYYFRARYYHPGIARFVQEDPIGFAGGLNLYGYGNGNPTNGRDSDGLAMNYEATAYDPNDWANLNQPDGFSTWDSWLFAADGVGGGGWLPSDAAWAYDAFVMGQIGIAIAGSEIIIVQWTTDDGTSHSVEMEVLHRDFDESVNTDMVFAAARAVEAVGFTNFLVTSFTCCHDGGQHPLGLAMDIGALGQTTVRDFANGMGANPLYLNRFIRELVGELPVGGRVLAPWAFGMERAGSGLRDIDMMALTRRGDPLWVEHWGHVHLGWPSQ